MTDKTKVQILIETTVWDEVKKCTIPNHAYILDAASKRLIGYIKAGTKELVRFGGKGLSFDRRGRTFNVMWRYI